jgi:phosphonate transport system substrate-binding protein
MKRCSLIQRTALLTTALLATIFLVDASKNGLSFLEKPAIADVTELNFGIISTESQAHQRPVWEPFIQAMSRSIGIPVKAFYVTQYSGVIEGMRFGKVQAAWYGGKSYIEAAKRSNAEAFAQIINPDGTRGYYSYIIGNKDNSATAQAKAEGYQYILKNSHNLTFAFNDPESTSGYLVPSYYIFTKHNVNPKQAFKRLTFVGSHEATALAVAHGQVDFATNNSEDFPRIADKNPIVKQKIVVVWKSPVLPSDPIAYRKDLTPVIKAKIRNFFYNFHDQRILGPLKMAGFAPAQDKTWNVIRDLDKAQKQGH